MVSSNCIYIDLLMKRLLVLLILPFFTFAQQPVVDLQNFASGFTRPVDIQNVGDDRLFILEQRGMIWIVDSTGQVNPRPFLDIRSRVNDAANEQGLLGLAFHPDYALNRSFFVHYNDAGDSTVISLFQTSNDPDSADPNSEFLIMKEYQPFQNHNGGSIEFGPDGYLYIALGDGGSGGDPGDRAQDLTTVLGKILRININTAMPYGIPPDNPFVGMSSFVREEIWAYGLRNPWKISFDRLTGDIWMGDVGQNDWEEIDFQPASSMGGENYGWRCREGAHVFNPAGCPPDSTMVDPVYEYAQAGNGCSVTGGRVYRGNEFPRLYGHYIFSDACGGWIRTLDSAFNMIDHGVVPGGNYFVAFGEDRHGEVYVASMNNGIIYKVTDISTGLAEKIEGSSFELFPNPASKSVTLKLTEYQNPGGIVEVYDQKGIRVSEKIHIQRHEYKIGVEGLLPGIYFIKHLDGLGNCATKRLIVE